VWVPISIYLLATAHIAKAVVLALFGTVGIGLVDNVVRPLFITGRTRMSFLLTFLAVFGGIGAFGLLGVVLGPLVLALFLSVVHIARDYERKEMPHVKDGR
jgi:predicted PurR-regulated permease PerM